MSRNLRNSMRRHGPWRWSTTFRVCGSKAQIWNALPCTSWLSAPPVFGRRAIMAGFASVPHMLWSSPCYWVPVRLSHAILPSIPGHSAVDRVPQKVRSVGEIPRSSSRLFALGHSRGSAARHLLNPSFGISIRNSWTETYISLFPHRPLRYLQVPPPYLPSRLTPPRHRLSRFRTARLPFRHSVASRSSLVSISGWVGCPGPIYTSPLSK